MAIKFRVELLEEELSRLASRVEGIEHAVVLSLDGFVVASFPGGSKERVDSPLSGPLIAATAANAIALGEQVLGRLEHGSFERLIAEGQNGAMIIYPIHQTGAALVATISKDTRMGLASLAMRRCTSELAKILHSHPEDTR